MPQDDITRSYTTGRMTAKTIGAILSTVKKGQQVRKGKGNAADVYKQNEKYISPV